MIDSLIEHNIFTCLIRGCVSAAVESGNKRSVSGICVLDLNIGPALCVLVVLLVNGWDERGHLGRWRFRQTPVLDFLDLKCKPRCFVFECFLLDLNSLSWVQKNLSFLQNQDIDQI